MKMLIDQRPNLIPVGVGHALDDVDTDAILGGNTRVNASEPRESADLGWDPSILDLDGETTGTQLSVYM